MGSVFQRGLSRISRRKKKERRELTDIPELEQSDHNIQPPPPPVEDIYQLAESTTPQNASKSSLLGRGMDRLRRSIRQSFRKKRSPERLPSAELVANNGEAAKHEQWQPDEGAVRAGLCSFNVKYLGAVEVFDSRGMKVCDGALKMLRSNRRRPVKAVLSVSGDGLRVVDQQSNRGLIVDQTIEKVSFCAPDRNNDRGFAYICRDGTSRRWMCHGFTACKDKGERISHAVGCAFQICLDRKKKRDEESGVGASTTAGAGPSSDDAAPVSVEKALNPDWGERSVDEPSCSSSSSANPAPPLQRTNMAYQSFRKQVPISERLQDPQGVIVNNAPSSSNAHCTSSIAKPRPTANPALFQRQGSLRAPQPQTTSEFRRNLSLRSTSVDNGGGTRRAPFGQTLYSEPIYEGDEENLTGHLSSAADNTFTTASYSSSTAPPSTAHYASNPMTSLSHTGFSNYLDESTSSLFGSPSTSQFGAAPFATAVPTVASTMTSSMSGGLSQWNAFDSSGNSGVAIDQLININTQCTAPSAPSSSSHRSKADDWLNDAIRTSLSMTSPPPPVSMSNSNQLTVANGWSSSQPQASGCPAVSHHPLLDSPLSSGPPPSHPPPPLPSKNAVVNGTIHYVVPSASSAAPAPFPAAPASSANSSSNSSNTFSSSSLSPPNNPSPRGVDLFDQTVQWDAAPPTIPKPDDPFDIQWSRLAVTGGGNTGANPFSKGREVSI